MSKRLLALLAAGLLAATAAQAQDDGGGGSDNQDIPEAPPPPNLNRVEIVGVVRAIDRPAQRITIAYEPVDALSWQAGTMAFVVSKSALLNDVTVGEKVRFRVASQQIVDLVPFGPKPEN